MYGRVVISAHKDFNNQLVAQRAMLELRQTSPRAVVVVGANKGDKMVGRVWRAIGGHVLDVEPNFAKGVKPADAMRKRDQNVINVPTDLCISFEMNGRKGWMALLCESRQISIKHYDGEIITIDADI